MRSMGAIAAMGSQLRIDKLDDLGILVANLSADAEMVSCRLIILYH